MRRRLSAQKMISARRLIIFFLSVVLLFLSASCKKEAVSEERISGMYRNADGFSAVLSVELDHGDHTTAYKLEFTYASDNGYVIRITEPVSLAGLETKISGSALEITYEGVVFAPERLDGVTATPVKLLPATVESWKRGLADTIFYEKEDGKRLAILDIFAAVEGDEIMLRTWFDDETLLPVRSEAFYDGKRVMKCEFLNAEFSKSE